MWGEMLREPCNENSWMVQSIRVWREEKRYGCIETGQGYQGKHGDLSVSFVIVHKAWILCAQGMWAVCTVSFFPVYYAIQFLHRPFEEWLFTTTDVHLGVAGGVENMVPTSEQIRDKTRLPCLVSEPFGCQGRGNQPAKHRCRPNIVRGFCI